MGLIFRWKRCEQVYGLKETGEDGELGDQIESTRTLAPMALFLRGEGGERWRSERHKHKRVS